MKDFCLFTVRCLAMSVAVSAVLGQGVWAAEGHQSARAAKIRSFFQSIDSKLERADALLANGGGDAQGNVLPEGEVLFLNVRLPQRITLEGIIFGQSKNKKIVISLKDFVQVFNFPIDLQAEEQRAQGWYIRETKRFDLDLGRGSVETDHGVFTISENVFAEDDDIFVPIDELAQWIDFKMEPRVSSQEVLITPSQPLPVQEKRLRKKKNWVAHKIPAPVLPRMDFPKKAIDVPVIDVISNVSYEKDGGTKEGERRANGTITSRGDFAYGTLKTRSQYNDRDGLRGSQVSYEQQSDKPDLLGPLKARRYEIGDVTTASLPLVSTAEQNLGFKITNRDPLNTLSSPTSVISGTIFPGWDVELYRDNQFLGLESVDENGFFSFDNIGLFSQDNDFKLILYGPQGEIRERTVSIPVDKQQLSDSAGVYDVSFTLADEQAYLKDRSGRDEDSGSLNVRALYERPIGGSAAVSLGFSSNQADGTRNYVSQAGISSRIKDTLVNVNVAIDDEAEMNAELALRHNFGKHRVSSTTSYLGEGFDSSQGDQSNPVSVFRENLSAVGPLPFWQDLRSRYSANTNFTETADGDTTISSTVGASAQWNGLTFNEQLRHLRTDSLEEDQIDLLSTLSGTYGKNRIRTIFDYEIKPDPALSSVLASVVHEVSDTLDIRAEVDKTFEPSLTEGSLSLDWKAGFARLSPRVEYNSENDLFVGIGSRYSILREPHRNTFGTTDRTVSGNGGFSAFVYLDENGNRVFDEGEAPLENVVVKALQNGGIETTDENGIAVFSNMLELKLTDVQIEEFSLEDPLWIPGFEGVSVLPREGAYAKAEFPIHIAGEVDGTVYGVPADGVGERVALKNIGLNLYALSGDLQASTVTDLGGFYFFSRVPPGTYYLIVNESSAKFDNISRPLPRRIEVGYDGTLIFGEDIEVTLDTPDVPSVVLKDYEVFEALHPHVSFDDLRHHLVLNLGEYSSQIHMGLRWYKLKKAYGALMRQADLYVSPKQSYANPQSGKHSLRVGLVGQGLPQAYDICRRLISGGFDCRVEILPRGRDILSLSAL